MPRDWRVLKGVLVEGQVGVVNIMRRVFGDLTEDRNVIYLQICIMYRQEAGDPNTFMIILR